jgi:flagellar protein FlaJ
MSFILFVPISFIFFLIQSPVFLIALAKSLVLGMIFSCLVFAVFFIYPQMRIKSRVRSINTNLPFAIDHMSSVTASGVPPATMFKLIADSREYGEVSFEIEKISNYIDLFGYDLNTAIRTVAVTTPSQPFKEFFEGMINTIESGGDLKSYLSEKSKEALLSYRLERQKYVEAISTYSDIYIGILIAAPLFFISTLALVSMLGGSVGGMAIDTLIALGTYLVIPVLNILFIVFLEVNQPQV